MNDAVGAERSSYLAYNDLCVRRVEVLVKSMQTFLVLPVSQVPGERPAVQSGVVHLKHQLFARCRCRHRFASTK